MGRELGGFDQLGAAFGWGGAVLATNEKSGDDLKMILALSW
jgi:hypothetical protein